MRCKHCGLPIDSRGAPYVLFEERHAVPVGPTSETQWVPADAGLFCSRGCLRDYLATPLPKKEPPEPEWLQRVRKEP